MGLLDKMIEKIGIVDEEYDEEEVAEQTAAPKEKVDESIPPEFLQHTRKKPVAVEVADKKSAAGSEITAAKPVLKSIPKQDEKLAFKKVEPEEKKGTFSVFKSKEKQELNAVTVLAKALHVIIVRPESFDDSQQIAEYLKREQSVIVNYEKTDEVVSARINDFVCGVVYAIGGTIQKIDQKSMFCAPKMVDVDNKEGSFE